MDPPDIFHQCVDCRFHQRPRVNPVAFLQMDGGSPNQNKFEILQPWHLNMNWAMRLSLLHLRRVGELRAMPGTLAAVDGDWMWLRGERLDSGLHRVLTPTADGPVFVLADDNRLTPFGSAVPTGRLPELAWKPLVELLDPILPPSEIGVARHSRVSLTLERTTAEKEAGLLLADWQIFRDWALSAPDIRLHACRFALPAARGGAGHLPQKRPVAILGAPLPPLCGERYWMAGSIAVPAGYHWSPAVDVKTLETVICRGNPDYDAAKSIWIWRAENNATEEIQSAQWIIVTRANVRATELAIC